MRSFGQLCQSHFLVVVGLFVIFATSVALAKPFQHGSLNSYLRHQQLQQHNFLRPQMRRPSSYEESGSDYEDFPVVPPILRSSYDQLPKNFDEEDLFAPPGKRYLGIDIPDYISAGGKSDAIKNMSNRMKSLGRKK